MKYIAIFLSAVVIIMIGFIGGYFVGYSDAKNDFLLEKKKDEKKRHELLKKLEDSTKKAKESVSSRLKEVLKKETQKELEKKSMLPKTPTEEKKEIKADLSEKLQKEVLKVKEYAGASHEYGDSELAKPPVRVKKRVKKSASGKPKLAIIIDDVSVRSHVNAIKSLEMPITMSFLPPSKFRPNSAKLASHEEFYMVHLPMEAEGYSAEEPDTLRVKDSQKHILKRVEEIQKLFPNVKYMNNHTGSKFTANEIAMNRLINVFKTHDISFIDSRTTADTKAPKVLKNFGYKYMSRDIFLDHHMDKPYIKNQIKKAIKIAKAEGVAIAIGHPHANTILALHESKKLFKDVELVYINKAY